MAVEIKELVIRAVIDYPKEPVSGVLGASEGSRGEAEHEAIVQACVRQVLKIINRSNKR